MAFRQRRSLDITWPLIKRLSKEHIWPHKKELIRAVIAMLVMAGALSVQAHLIQPLFDNGLIGRSIGVLNTLILTLLGLTLAKGFAGYFQSYYMEAVGQKLVAEVQERMYARTLSQSLDFFAQHPTGTLTSRFVADLGRLKNAITQTFSSGLRDSGTIIGLLINMLIQDVRLTLITMLILPLTIIPIKRFGRLSRKYSRVNQEGTARLSHLLAQSLQHIRQVQSFTNEEQEIKRVNARIADVLGTTLKSVRVRAASSPIVEAIGTVAIAVLMLYAARRITNGTLTPGEFASFIASLIMIIRPIKGLTNLNNSLQDGLAAAQRAFELIDMPITVKDTPNAKALKVTQGAISFKNVTLTYPDGTIALNHFNLDIAPGSTVALVGPSGAGKTSVLNLLPRFYDITSGNITIDEQDTRQVTLRSLRQNIGLVSQDIAIFDDTIAANLGYGSGHVTEEQLRNAAKAAAADKFIEALPDGYNTILGENGLKLSGGQRQRLAIARALIKNAPILLLDEATASLDTESERQVQSAFEELMHGRTTLVVAHRLSTVTKADKIIVLSDGNVLESGTHEQLLGKKGLYSHLWSLQSEAESKT